MYLTKCSVKIKLGAAQYCRPNHIETQIVPSEFHWRIRGPSKRPFHYFIPLDTQVLSTYLTGKCSGRTRRQRQFDVVGVERFTLGDNLRFFLFFFIGMHIPSGSWWKHSAINYVSHGLSKRSFAHISTETRPLMREPKENVSQHWEKGAVAFSHKPTGGAFGPASCQYLVPTCLVPGTDLALARTWYTPCRWCRIKQLKRLKKGRREKFYIFISKMT